MSAAQTLATVREKILELAEGIEPDSPLEELVEAGTVLAAIVNLANTELAEIKADLRDHALDELRDEAGSCTFEGLDVGQVTVTVLSNKVSFVKGTDPEVLKTKLGDDFDLYVETKITYIPRKNAAELAAKVATGQERDLLLCSLEETPQTPRVSFRKL